MSEFTYLKMKGQYITQKEKDKYNSMEEDQKRHVDDMFRIHDGPGVDLNYIMRFYPYYPDPGAPPNTDTYKGNKEQRKIDPNENKFHEILKKVTDSEYTNQMRMVSEIADDIFDDDKKEKDVLKQAVDA